MGWCCVVLQCQRGSDGAARVEQRRRLHGRPGALRETQGKAAAIVAVLKEVVQQEAKWREPGDGHSNERWGEKPPVAPAPPRLRPATLL